MTSRTASPLVKRIALGLLAAAACFTLVGCNDNLKKENAQLKTENTDLNARLTDAQQQLQTSEQARQSLQAQLAAAPQGGGGGGGGGGGKSMRNSGSESDQIITVAGDALFSPGSADIKKDAKSQLDKIAKELNGKYSGHQIQVIGHTDSDPLKKSAAKWGNNDNLSQARAQSVADYLAKKGVSKSRMTVIGKGSSQPKGDKKSSRRVEIVVMANG